MNCNLRLALVYVESESPASFFFFVVVLYSIYQLNHGPAVAPNGPLNAFLGTAGQVNLCPTRIVSIREKNGISHLEVIQEDLEWKRLQPNPKNFDKTEMEVWLGKNCVVASTGESIERREVADQVPLSMTEIAYVDGKTRFLRRFRRGVFEFEGQLFKSPQLDAALATLAAH